MIVIRRLAMIPLAALYLCLFAGIGASADDRSSNEQGWRQYRAAKRQQVSDLCDLWFPDWRPKDVGKTYVCLAEKYANLDTSRCSPALRKHVNKAERTCTEIGELFGQGTMPDITVVLRAASGGCLFKSSSAVSRERGRRVLELMRDLSASEDAVVKELGLGE